MGDDDNHTKRQPEDINPKDIDCEKKRWRHSKEDKDEIKKKITPIWVFNWYRNREKRHQKTRFCWKITIFVLFCLRLMMIWSDFSEAWRVNRNKKVQKMCPLHIFINHKITKKNLPLIINGYFSYHESTRKILRLL